MILYHCLEHRKTNICRERGSFLVHKVVKIFFVLSVPLIAALHSFHVAAPEDGGGGGAEVAPADGRLHDRQVLPPGEDQREFPGTETRVLVRKLSQLSPLS